MRLCEFDISVSIEIQIDDRKWTEIRHTVLDVQAVEMKPSGNGLEFVVANSKTYNEFEGQSSDGK